MLKKHDELEITVDEVKFPNIGIVSTFDKELRIKGLIKGEKAKVRVSKKRKNHYEAKVIELIDKSPLEINTPCDHFGICGGCSYQTLNYEDELRYKLDQVYRLFETNEIKINKDELDIIPSPIITGYRNKMEFTFGDEYKDGPLSLGMHRKNSFYEIETVRDCNICDEDFTKILTSVLDNFRDKNYTFYHKKRHIGLLRNLVIRKALSTNEIMINIVTTSKEKFDSEEFVELILELDLKGEVVSILHSINDGVADIVRADELFLLYGREYITEKICDLEFKISPFSFFQTNTFGAEVLYNTAKEFMGDISNKTVFDLYSGTGTIAQIMAKSAKEVVAVEIVDEAVDKAIENAKLNNIENIKFNKGDVFKVLDEINVKPDLIVIDPPRPGLEKATQKILDYNPKEFLYISCNPVTLVNDLKVFLQNDYSINKIILVDQFPRTPHTEVVTLLTRSEASCK